ncbi:alpha/beta hydrolase family protein [Novosphingobium colocasiae]|uniref:alpha/beta hydrolase family protein n=1 Tax=Novosphingobium colocasiae TaxID=1256513 RepID=UPI0035B0CFAA
MPFNPFFSRAATAAAATLGLMAGPAAYAAPPAPPPLEAYGELPGVSSVTLSEDGNKIAAILRSGENNVLAVFDPSGKITYNASTGTAKVRAVTWVGNDTLLVRTSTTVALGIGFTAARAELGSTIIVRLDGSKPEVVFAGRTNIAQTTRGFYGVRKVDGVGQPYIGGIVAEVTRGGSYLNNTNSTLFRIDTRKNSPTRVAEAAPPEHGRDWLIGPDGTVSATLDIASKTGDWTIKNAKGVKLASGNDPTGAVGLFFFGKDGSTIIYGKAEEDKTFNWYEVPLAGGTPVPFLKDEEIEQTYVDPLNGNLLGYLPDRENAKPVFYDPKHQAVANQIAKAFSKYHMEMTDWNGDFSKVLVRTDGGEGDSGTWYYVDVASLRANSIAYEREAIMPEQVGAISTIAYKAADGLDLDGILTLPPGREAKNLPVVMLPHGGPASYDSPSFDWWAQAFASRGYAVFQPNFRGSTNRDSAFKHAGDGEWGRKMQTDISDGLAELARRGIIDPKRACIMGASYGGYAALAGVTLQNGLYRCSVAVAGVADVARMYTTDVRESGYNPMARKGLQEQLGDPTKLGEVSPRRFAARADAPILLIHGKDDTVVPFVQSTGMAEALKNAGKPYEFVTLKEEDHWLSRAATRKQMLEAAMAFVQKYNPAD